MSGNIDTRESSISDYDATVKLWQRVEGLEIAAGDDKESVTPCSRGIPGLSRVATDERGWSVVRLLAVPMDAADTIYIWQQLILPYQDADWEASRTKCLEVLRRAGVKARHYHGGRR